MTNLRAIFACNVKRFRTEQHLSQEAFAELCGMHRTYISDIERCGRNVSIDNIDKIATALKMDAADLFKK